MDEEVLYTREHYWVTINNGIATIGLSEYVTDKFDEVSYIEIQSVGSVCNKTDIIGAISFDGDEFEICSAFTGEIMEINDILVEEPQGIKNSINDNSWIYKISIINKDELAELMNEEEYSSLIDEL